MKTKNEIRKEIRQLLKSQETKFFEQNSKKICEKIISWNDFNNAQLIAFFIPLPTEVDLTKCIIEAQKNNKICLIPKVNFEDENFSMDFYALDNNQNLENQLTPGSYGIKEPKQTLLKYTFTDNKALKTLFFLPGLAFDLQGNRLGKGKGFYDRFFSKINLSVLQNSGNITLAAVCYSLQIINTVPNTSKDQKFDVLITEKSIINCKNN